jgi:hypothetical protein
MFSQPLKTRLHEYEHNSTLQNIDNSNKVDSYFYYDLTRFTLEIIDELINKSLWPQKMSFPKCGKHLNDEQKHERSVIELAKELSIEALYGMFGRFVFDSYKFGNNYQEISMRINKVVLSADSPNKNTKIAEWEYEGHTGSIMFTAAQEAADKKSASGVPHYDIVTIVVSIALNIKQTLILKVNNNLKYNFFFSKFKKFFFTKS